MSAPELPPQPQSQSQPQPSPQPWPTELRLAAQGRSLRATFDDGAAFDLTAEALRLASRSAEVRGHGAAPPRPPLTGKADVRILGVRPVGRYAVRLMFDDGHDTGLYTWAHLYALGAAAV